MRLKGCKMRKCWRKKTNNVFQPVHEQPSNQPINPKDTVSTRLMYWTHPINQSNSWIDCMFLFKDLQFRVWLALRIKICRPCIRSFFHLLSVGKKAFLKIYSDSWLSFHAFFSIAQFVKEDNLVASLQNSSVPKDKMAGVQHHSGKENGGHHNGHASGSIKQSSDETHAEPPAGPVPDRFRATNLYDRQIRLWGWEAQQRLMKSRVLIFGTNGIGVEVLKNLMLGGVKEITIVDNAVVTELDLANNFFVRRGDIGSPRVTAVRERAALLSPACTLTAVS